MNFIVIKVVLCYVCFIKFIFIILSIKQIFFMKLNISHVLKNSVTSTYEVDAFYLFDVMLCDRERLPVFITNLLPKVLHKVFIPWDQIVDFSNRDKDWLLNKMGSELENELKGSFFKLSSCSSKDCGLPKFVSCEDIKWIPEDSVRWYEYLRKARKYCMGTYLWFFEWLDDCSVDKEVRIFVKEGKVQGVTAYNYRDKIYNFADDFMEKAKSAVEEKILNVLATQHALQKNWELKEFVIDAYEKADGSVQFLEINPYWHSDPCCFGKHDSIGNPLFCKK